MDSLFVQYLAIWNNENLPKSKNKFQSKFKSSTNYKVDCQIDLKFSQKGRFFSKSGHIGHGQCQIASQKIFLIFKPFWPFQMNGFPVLQTFLAFPCIFVFIFVSQYCYEDGHWR